MISKLIESGLEVTAVHNHLLRANPATFYLHVGGHGDPAKMAAAIRRCSRDQQDTTERSGAGCCRRVRTRHGCAGPGARRQRQRERGHRAVCGTAARTGREGGIELTPPGPLGVATGINFQATGAARPRLPAISCCSAARSIP